MNMVLTFKGMDSFDRPVYIDEAGKLWKDVDPLSNCKPNLCTAYNNEFDGEPDTPMKYIKRYEGVKIEFIPERKIWR